MDGQVVFLEDHDLSVGSEVEIARDLGLEVIMCPLPHSLANHLASERNEALVALLLDMHIPEVKDLREIGMRSVKTDNGNAVGLAVAERFLRTPASGVATVPLGFLTAYEVHDEAERRIHALSHGRNDAMLFRKGKQVEQFERFLISARAAREHELGREPKHYSQSVQLACKIVDSLFEEDVRAPVLGLFSGSELDLASYKKKIAECHSVDFSDRAALIIELQKKLDQVFGEDVSVQREWMAASQNRLFGKSPIEALRRGHQQELLQVIGLLRLVTG